MQRRGAKGNGIAMPKLAQGIQGCKQGWSRLMGPKPHSRQLNTAMAKSDHQCKSRFCTLIDSAHHLFDEMAARKFLLSFAKLKFG